MHPLCKYCKTVSENRIEIPKISPQSHSIVVLNVKFAKRVYNHKMVFFSTFLLIVGIISVSSLGIAEGAIQRDIIIKPIFTMRDGNGFNHVFAVCSSQLVKDDIIIVLSDSAVSPIKIQDNEKIDKCTTFNSKILAIDPITIKAEMFKIESKNKTIERLENKIVSLDNIVERKMLERDEIIRNSIEPKDDQKAFDMISRISELIDYKNRVEKKLAIILSI